MPGPRPDRAGEGRAAQMPGSLCPQWPPARTVRHSHCPACPQKSREPEISCHCARSLSSVCAPSLCSGVGRPLGITTDGSTRGALMPRAEPTDRIRQLEESRARINAEIQRVKGRAQQEERKRETRRKILVGSMVLDWWSAGSGWRGD